MKKRYEYFRIQGDWDTTENKALYWDDVEQTWVDFDNATIYDVAVLYIMSFPVAPHTIQIVWVNEMGTFVERDDMATAFGRPEAMACVPMGKKCLTCIKSCGKVVA